MNLELTKPLAIFDLETTGINITSDRIVEISILKLFPGGKEEQRTYKVNPQMPIPAQASAIHGIYDKDVANEPTFAELSKELAPYLKDCDFAGYNSNKFDVPLLAEEFARVGVQFDWSKAKFVDVQVLFHKKEPRTLSAAYKFYCDKDLENAHSAAADTFATLEVLKAQLDRYTDVEPNVQFLSTFTAQSNKVDFAGRIILDENKIEIFNFGKHKGKTVESVFKAEPGYYSWMMNGDFPANTKQVITAIKLRSFGS
ncbi:MAG: 3'-5' exonuclease [Bacteroidales bacterium]|nr:3'-5' exonuclease [Bacteroidales bacterium]